MQNPCNRFIYSFLLVLIFFFSLISVANVGGQIGILAPYNFSVYVGVGVFVLLNVWTLFKKQYVIFVPWQVVFTFFWLFIVGFSTNGTDLERFLYQSLAAFMGLLFVLSFLQNKCSEYRWYIPFYALSILGLIQALIALDQRFDAFKVLYYYTDYFPFKFHDGYLGSLQQKNIFASFMAFSVVLASYLFIAYKWRVYALIPLMALIFIGTFEIVNGGSRAGLIGWLVGLLILMVALKSYWQAYKTRFIGLVLLLCAASLLGIFVEPVGSSSVDKIANVVSGTDARLFLYSTTWSMIIEKPLLGYGIGSFADLFQRYITEHGLTEQWIQVGLSNSVTTHPHNELLYWLFQVGFIGVLPILILLLWIVRNWWQQGKSHFFLAVAISFPLIFQAMVSYPFTLSALHYFLTLFLLFYFTKLDKSVITFNCSFMCRALGRAVVFVLLIGLLVFGYRAMQANSEIYYFKQRLFLYKEYPQNEQVGYFKYASSVPWFTDLVHANMENLFNNAVRDNNFYDLKQYLLWYNNQSALPEKFDDYAAQSRLILQSHGKNGGL